MHVKKIAISIMALSIVLSGWTSTRGSAAEINNKAVKNNYSPEAILKSDSLAQNRYEKLISNIHSKNKSKTMSSTDTYINIKNVSTDPSHPIYKSKKYTKQEFLTEMNREKSVVFTAQSPVENIAYAYQAPISQANSWLRLTLEIDDAGTSQRDIYGFYQWITAPMIADMDIISLGHDANTNFDFSQNYCDSFIDFQIWNNDGTYTDSYYSRHFTPADTSNRVLDVGGIGYNFNLSGYGPMGKDRYQPNDYPYGDIYVRATPGASSNGPITLTYAHKQFSLTFDPSYSIPSGGSLKLGFATYYDKFTIADTIHF